MVRGFAMPQVNLQSVEQQEERRTTRRRQGIDGQVSDEQKTSRPRERKKEYTGSRWIGVALLLLTALLSYLFSLQGKGATFRIGGVLDRISEIFFGSSTMTFER